MTTRQDIRINQGETWSYVYTHRDGAGSAIDLTGYSARMAVKASYEDGSIAYLSTGSDAEGGTIVLGGMLGTVTMSMSADQTTNLTDANLYGFLPPDKRKKYERDVSYIYDLELVSGAGVVTRVLEGRCIVHREVTG